MNTIEQLRWVAEADWGSSGDLILTALDLLFELSSDRSEMLASAKRLLQSQPGVAELWSALNATVGSMQLAADLFEVRNSFEEHLEDCPLHDSRSKRAVVRRGLVVPMAISEEQFALSIPFDGDSSDQELFSCAWFGLPGPMFDRFIQSASSAGLELMSMPLSLHGGVHMDGQWQVPPFAFGQVSSELMMPLPARLGTGRRRSHFG